MTGFTTILAPPLLRLLIPPPGAGTSTGTPAALVGAREGG
jgi:hypothetical protein